MTTIAIAACAGATTCRRPATWHITTNYGRVYATNQGYVYSADRMYCKAHAAAEQARLVTEVSQADRDAAYQQETRRSGAIHPIYQAERALRDITGSYWRLQAEQLRPEDAAWAADIRAEIATLDLGRIADALESLYQRAQPYPSP